MSAVSHPGLIREWIHSEGGFLPLYRFMEKALYDPEHGYYSCYIKGVGKEGDFTTAAVLSGLLGRAVAGWLLESRHHQHCGFRWDVIEVGGGDGSLAESVLTQLGMLHRLGCRFTLAEISPVLRSLQQQKLSRFMVRWTSSLEQALEASRTPVFIFSNELLDAFPCHQFIFQDGVWWVVGLVLNEKGEVMESVRHPQTQDEQDAFRFLDIDPSWEKAGRRLEVQWSIRHWISQWAPKIQEGCFLAVDYGDDAAPLARRFPYGSLRAYFQHQVLDGMECYRRVGRQDLTVDVNFTHLCRWMSELGWQRVSYQTQGDFISRYVSPQTPQASDLEKHLTSQSGAGSAFKVACFQPVRV